MTLCGVCVCRACVHACIGICVVFLCTAWVCATVWCLPCVCVCVHLCSISVSCVWVCLSGWCLCVLCAHVCMHVYLCASGGRLVCVCVAPQAASPPAIWDNSKPCSLVTWQAGSAHHLASSLHGENTMLTFVATPNTLLVSNLTWAKCFKNVLCF